MVDHLLISILLVGLSARHSHSRKSRNGVRQSSNGSTVISMPKTSSGIDSGGDLEKGINSLRPNIVIWRSSPSEVERETVRGAKASTFAFVAHRTWSILTS